MKAMIKFKKIAIDYLKKNYKEYILMALIFIIGTFMGVFFINNYSAEKEELISKYILGFIEKFKSINNINFKELLFLAIKNNAILTIAVWLAGTTIIGLPLVFGIIIFRGFCLGYTIASICYTLGRCKGILFCLALLFFQNILFIPSILTLGVSSINLYKSIVNDRRKENIKIEIIKHTMISILMFILLVFSSFIEIYISTKCLKSTIKFF